MGKVFPWMLRGLIFLSILGLFPLGVVDRALQVAMAQVQLIPRFFVTYYQSHNEPAKTVPGGSEASVTVVTISSLGGDCAAEVLWRDDRGDDVCRTSSERIISRASVNHCSRPFATMAGVTPGVFPRCDETCDGTPGKPQLLNKEGAAVVSVTSGCQVLTGVDVRIYYTAYVSEPPDTEIVLGAHSPQVLKITDGSLE